MNMHSTKATESTAYNSTYKKLAVQWLNEVLCFYFTFVLADSLVLRNARHRQALNPETLLVIV